MRWMSFNATQQQMRNTFAWTMYDCRFNSGEYCIKPRPCTMCPHFGDGLTVKTVTRRAGWGMLKSGTPMIIHGNHLLAVSELRSKTTEIFGVIKIVDIRSEPLESITQNEVVLEGFPGKSVGWFIDLCLRINSGMKADSNVQRIQFVPHRTTGDNRE